MSSARQPGGTRLSPAPPQPRRGVETFNMPDLTVEAPAQETEQDPVPGFTPLLMMDEPEEDPRVSAEEQARSLLSSAQAEAESLRKKSQQEGYQEGYQKGYQTGLDEGMVASRARVEAACDNLGRSLTVLDKVRAGILSVMEAEMVALVQAATDRILLAPEAIDPALVRRAVHEAVQRVVEAERLLVRLHPDDLGHIKEFRGRLMEELGGLAHLELRADPGLRRGDCVVDTPTAQVDATLETRRQRIFKLLGDSFRQSQRLDMNQVLERALGEPPAADAPATCEPADSSDAGAAPAPPEPPAGPADASAPSGKTALEDW